MTLNFNSLNITISHPGIEPEGADFEILGGGLGREVIFRQASQYLRARRRAGLAFLARPILETPDTKGLQHSPTDLDTGLWAFARARSNNTQGQARKEQIGNAQPRSDNFVWFSMNHTTPLSDGLLNKEESC